MKRRLAGGGKVQEVPAQDHAEVARRETSANGTARISSSRFPIVLPIICQMPLMLGGEQLELRKRCLASGRCKAWLLAVGFEAARVTDRSRASSRCRRARDAEALGNRHLGRDPGLAATTVSTEYCVGVMSTAASVLMKSWKIQSLSAPHRVADMAGEAIQRRHRRPAAPGRSASSSSASGSSWSWPAGHGLGTSLLLVGLILSGPGQPGSRIVVDSGGPERSSRRPKPQVEELRPNCGVMIYDFGPDFCDNAGLFRAGRYLVQESIS